MKIFMTGLILIAQLFTPISADDSYIGDEAVYEPELNLSNYSDSTSYIGDEADYCGPECDYDDSYWSIPNTTCDPINYADFGTQEDPFGFPTDEELGGLILPYQGLDDSPWWGGDEEPSAGDLVASDDGTTEGIIAAGAQDYLTVKERCVVCEDGTMYLETYTVREPAAVACQMTDEDNNCVDDFSEDAGGSAK